MLDSGLVSRGSQQHRTQLPPDGSRTTLDDPPSPRQKWVLTSESFDRLLLWLDHDREQAGLKYEAIRSALIKRFGQLGCRDAAEELADLTFDRVAGKLSEISEYKGDPEPYVFSVAYFVYKEYLRRPIIASLNAYNLQDPATPNTKEMIEKELLDSCLQE